MNIVCQLLGLYLLVLFAAIVLSWFPIQPGTAMATVHSVLWRLTDPILGPIRRAIPAVRIGAMALDLSPFIVILGITILRGILCS